MNVTPVADTQGVYMYDKDSSSNVVETYDDGQVVIQGLEAGTYYLKEVKPPAGYNVLSKPEVIEVGEGTKSFNIFDRYFKLLRCAFSCSYKPC